MHSAVSDGVTRSASASESPAWSRNVIRSGYCVCISALRSGPRFERASVESGHTRLPVPVRRGFKEYPQ